jgi:selenium metabolism protein YedF
MTIDTDLLLIFKSSSLGDGPMDLGEKLIENLMKALLESGTLPSRIICMNNGVFLSTMGSPVEGLMREFESKGVEILSCGTCLEYHGRKDKLIVGKPTTMHDSVAAMLNFKKILTP